MADFQGHRSSLKQQNKPFKGKKAAKDKNGRTETVGKSVSEWVEQSKAARKNHAAQKRKSLREEMVSKARGMADGLGVKVVCVLTMHADADSQALITDLQSSCEFSDFFKLPDKSNVLFLNVPRTELGVLDCGKVADCFLLVFSCKNADLTRVKLDPSSCCAYDETGYTLLSALKTQGFPQALGILQDLSTIPQKKQKEVKKLYSRYYLSEVPEGGKLQPAFKKPEILRDICTAVRTSEDLPYRAFRTYFLAHSVKCEQGISELTGILKGPGHLNVNQLIHITGIGDFNIHSLLTPNGEFLPDNPESIVSEKDPGPFAAEQTWPGEDELAEAFSRLEVKTDHKPGEVEEDEDDLVMSDDEKQPFHFEERKKEDFDFPDEVNTPSDQLAKVRFQKFRGLASFRTSEWDKYENLPQEYSRIYEFKEPSHIVKKIAVENSRDMSQTSAGMLVTVRIANFPGHLLQAGLPVIVSVLLPHESKLTVLHFRLEKNGDGVLNSKSPVTAHYGFRRVLCRPIYSEDASNDKFKYLATVPPGATFIASLFAPVSYGPVNVLLYKDGLEGSELAAIGSLLNFDPGRVIIKRALLTGYPLKIHKRKAVIRYMFLNPTDIRYFKPIELFTKAGLRGHIKESLGTHGHMKCVFNDFIKHSDIVCLPLYKRVFPKWDPQVWQVPS